MSQAAGTAEIAEIGDGVRLGPKKETRIEAIRRVAAETDTVFLSFSGGKDSVCSWIEARRHFREIVPIFHYWIPGLRFIERSLDYFEDFFDTPIIRVPHPAFYDVMRLGLFQDPVTVQVTDAWGFHKVDFAQQRSWIAEDYGVNSRWSCVGVTRNDSVNRRLVMDKIGFAPESTGVLYVIGDWRRPDKEKVIRDAGVKLSAEYQYIGRSFDGLGGRFVRMVRDRFPDDWRLLQKWLPLIELSIIREDMAFARIAAEARAAA